MEGSIFNCPLLQDDKYSLVGLPAYILTAGSMELVKVHTLGFQIPREITNYWRALNRTGIVPSWDVILLQTCGSHLCKQCVPGLSWGRGIPDMFIVPTNISPNQENDPQIPLVEP